jgi:hypothetical protein
VNCSKEISSVKILSSVEALRSPVGILELRFYLQALVIFPTGLDLLVR